MSHNPQFTTLPALTGTTASRVIMPAALEADLTQTDQRAVKNRLATFGAWMDATGRAWQSPDLQAYRDKLLADGKQPSTINAHLSTIRARYTGSRNQRGLLEDSAVLAWIDYQARAFLEAEGQPADLANVDAATRRVIKAIEGQLDPRASRVKEIKVQDRAASEFVRLTKVQARALLDAPGVATLKGLRDTALVAMLLCSGLREFELCALEVSDLRQFTEDGALAVLVREGKGGKQRLVPYGALDWALVLVDAWLRHAGIASGPVFRGFYKGNRRVRPGALTVRAVQLILAEYPVTDGHGGAVTVKPHDCRRTYARRFYEEHGDTALVALQQNLGHASLETTIHYVGAMSSEQRKPKHDMYGYQVKLTTAPLL